MSRIERFTRANAEVELMASLIDFLSPRPDEEIILGQVTKSRAHNSHFGVTLIKQRDRGDNLDVVGSQFATEKRLDSTAEELRLMLGLNIIRADEKERLTLVRKKILEITKEAKSKIKKSS